MVYWNMVWLVIVLGLTVVGPLIMLVVGVRGLGAGTLSEKQQRAGEKELREAGIVREGEEWEARDLDDLMLNMRRYDQWKSIGMAATVLLTGGVGAVALIAAARDSITSLAYIIPALGILLGSLALGVSMGYITSDRRFAVRAGALPTPQPEAIFSRVGGVARRPWWLRLLDAGLTLSVSVCTLLYALGKGGTLDNPTTRLAITHHPWLIWCIPVALGIILATQESLVWWELRRSPLRLAEQPELAERVDLHLRREACKGRYDSTPIGILSYNQLIAISSQALFAIEIPLLVVAFGSFAVSAFAQMLADSRRTKRGQRAGDAGLHGEGGVV